MSVKRENEDQITKIMGSYLLKGYTLLDTHCPNCQTPLMKTKTSNDYCIYCNEIRVKTKQKDIKTTNESPNGSAMIVDKDEDNSGTNRHRNDLNTNRVEFKEDIERSVAIVYDKINWASDRLKRCDQTVECLQLIDLIKSSADLILTLNQLTRQPVIRH